MSLETLIGAAVALAVPVWLVVEEVLYRAKSRATRGVKADVPAPAPRVGATAGLSRRAA